MRPNMTANQQKLIKGNTFSSLLTSASRFIIHWFIGMIIFKIENVLISLRIEQIVWNIFFYLNEWILNWKEWEPLLLFNKFFSGGMEVGMNWWTKKRASSTCERRERMRQACHTRCCPRARPHLSHLGYLPSHPRLPLQFWSVVSSVDVEYEYGLRSVVQLSLTSLVSAPIQFCIMFLD